MEKQQEVILYTENNRKIAVATAEELRNEGMQQGLDQGIELIG